MDQCREVMRFRRLSLRSEQAYLDWIKRFIFFHDKRHPKDMGQPEVTAFLTHLAVTEKVSASTQNQAFNSLLFLYRHVLGQDFGVLDGVERAKRLPRVPVVLSQAEVQRFPACFARLARHRQVRHLCRTIKQHVSPVGAAYSDDIAPERSFG